MDNPVIDDPVINSLHIYYFQLFIKCIKPFLISRTGLIHINNTRGARKKKVN